MAPISLSMRTAPVTRSVSSAAADRRANRHVGDSTRRPVDARSQRWDIDSFAGSSIFLQNDPRELIAPRSVLVFEVRFAAFVGPVEVEDRVFQVFGRRLVGRLFGLHGRHDHLVGRLQLLVIPLAVGFDPLR